jgi:fatty acid synthase
LQAGDPEELKGMALTFFKERKVPLLIGSVKSNIGHCEGASGLCGITKVLIAMESGKIPPNLHYNNPREGVDELVNGQMKVSLEALIYRIKLYSIV